MAGTSTLTATIKAVADGGNGSWTAVASAPVLDRDNEVIAAGALKWQGDRVPVHAEHFGELVGSGRPYYQGDVLYIDGEFASTTRAQEIRALVTEGHLGHMSVVFMAAKRDTSGRVPVITDGELLAVDFAPIPSNREARVLAARSFRHGNAALDRAHRVLAEAEKALAHARIQDARRVLASTAKRDPSQVLREAEQLLARMNGRN